MIKRWLIWGTPAIPLGMGLLAFAVLAGTPINNPVLFVRADLGTLLLIINIGLALLVLIGLFVWKLTRDAATEHALHSAEEQANAERRRFLQRLDHELKNPLMAMRAGLANLSGLSANGDYQESLSSIEGQVLRLSRLLRDLRKLADLESQPIDRMKVDLEDLLNEVMMVASERPEAAERNMSLTVPQAPWPLPLIEADWDLLFLAVHNLVDNALKYTLPGNTIELRAFEDGSAVVVEVADTGPGIPENELPHVWEELSRGYSARGVTGSGLGLALVRTIAERHGGRVTLRSRAGYGTVFSLRLPLG